MDRYFETELGRVLGFYDFSESASVVPPHIAGNTWFTESHEQTHLRLASSTAFGFLQRLVALVARKSSPGDHEKSRFSELFRLLLGCSFNVHEGAANYYPLKGGGARQFQDVVRIYSRLPATYLAATRPFEVALSPLTRQETEGWYFEDADICLAIAGSALNSNLLQNFMDPTSLSTLPGLMRSDSPDSRLKAILAAVVEHRIAPVWRLKLRETQLQLFGGTLEKRFDNLFVTGELFSRSNDNLVSRYFRFAFDYLSNEITGVASALSFITNSERHKQTQRLFSSWQEHFEKAGRAYLRGSSYEAPPPDSPRAAMMANDVRLGFGDRTVDTIVDASWFMKYRQIAADDLSTEVAKVRASPGCLLIVTIYFHLLDSVERAFRDRQLRMGDCMLTGLQIPPGEHSLHLVSPFGTTLTPEEFMLACETLEGRETAWKIDERVVNYASQEKLLLPPLPRPLFIVSNDESLLAIKDRVDSLVGKEGHAIVVLKKVGGQSNRDGTCVVLLTGGTTRVFYMSRITDGNWLMLKGLYQRKETVTMLDGTNKGQYPQYEELIEDIGPRLFVVPLFTYAP